MRGRSIEVDYLVIGAGAAGMAFTDALVAESDASVLMVDRRHSPGGHWNDAYPFVRLHQPSAFYGVNSRNLGEDRIDHDGGPNAGGYERATGPEICHYFQAVMRDVLVASGRVEFLPMTTCVMNGSVRVRAIGQLTGAEHEITVRRKVVDARYLEGTIPATHTPSFVVDDGVQCIPVGGLTRANHPAGGYVVIGAGKTAMDACTWLLDNGVDPDEIAWVKPRETWALDRASWQPREQVGRFMIGWAASIEAAASATSVPDLFGRLEECGHLCRVDTAVEPTMYRAGTLSAFEIGQLRSIEQVVRAGRVRRIQTDRIVLDGGDVATSTSRLHVDCTAEGLGRPPSRPIFEPHRVTIQQVRETSPTFNAALIGYLEATRHDVDELNALAPPNAYPDAATDWIRMRQLGLVVQTTWDRTPDVAEWLEASRLNISAGVLAHASESGVGPAIGAYLEHRDRAIENLGALRTQVGEGVDATR